jgi:hypothetical protein
MGTKSTKGSKKDKGGGGEPPMTLDDYHPLTSVSLGNIRPGGILAVHGNYMFTSEFAYGGIKSTNILTGEIAQVVPSVVPSHTLMERSALGMAYYEGAILVAGSQFDPTGYTFDEETGQEISGRFDPKLFFYKVETGEEIIACDPTGGAFRDLVDVTIVGIYAFVTDSKFNAIMVVDVEAALDGDCVVSSITTDPDLFLSVNGESLASGKKKCPDIINVPVLLEYRLTHPLCFVP